MTMIRWRKDPFLSQLANLQQEINRRFEPWAGGGGDEEVWGKFAPPMDVSEDAERYTVQTEVPGMDPKDISINLTGRTLTIRGEKKQEVERQDKNYHRVERSYGTFMRSVELPSSIDTEKVEANYDNGVLTVNVAKTEEVKPRQISIKTHVK